ncbi:hypothetical protein H920_00812 [Fukomys damarensis]|uniref:Uncharacterized protein n=1 Tax=Fukomys damarensis TaxID=885580 RepID=A0A091E4Z4_FUKDA|nr:hypothetical protein H920_00812 [Fukomys damarensis]
MMYPLLQTSDYDVQTTERCKSQLQVSLLEIDSGVGRKNVVHIYKEERSQDSGKREAIVPHCDTEIFVAPAESLGAGMLLVIPFQLLKMCRNQALPELHHTVPICSRYPPNTSSNWTTRKHDQNSGVLDAAK